MTFMFLQNSIIYKNRINVSNNEKTEKSPDWLDMLWEHLRNLGGSPINIIPRFTLNLPTCWSWNLSILRTKHPGIDRVMYADQCSQDCTELSYPLARYAPLTFWMDLDAAIKCCDWDADPHYFMESDTCFALNDITSVNSGHCLALSPTEGCCFRGMEFTEVPVRMADHRLTIQLTITY